MNLLQHLFGTKHPPHVDKQKNALEKYNAESERIMAKAEFERDRTARIATYLRCMDEGGSDCRIDISWEEMARQGMIDEQD
jgi:hypothetical protein